MGDDGEYQEAECTKSGARAVFVVVDMCCCCASVLQQISRVLCIEHCSSLEYAYKRGTSYQVCVELCYRGPAGSRSSLISTWGTRLFFCTDVEA